VKGAGIGRLGCAGAPAIAFDACSSENLHNLHCLLENQLKPIRLLYLGTCGTVMSALGRRTGVRGRTSNVQPM
jgi:hypothetical protein